MTASRNLKYGEVYRLLADLFPGRHKWRLIGVFAVSIVSAFFETVGVASILPFMALAINPDVLKQSEAAQSILRTLGVTSTQGGLIVVGVLLAAVIAFGNFAAAANIYFEQRFAAFTEIRFATTLFSGYMNQPYAFHVQRDAPSLLKVLNTDVTNGTQGVILPLTRGLSKLAMAAGILGVLVWRDPLVAGIVLGMLGLAYALIYQFFRGSQKSSGVDANEANTERVRVSQEGIAGLKELQILGRVHRACDEFAHATSLAARARAYVQTVSQIPRHVMETIGFGGILLISMLLIATSGGGAQAIIPVLALYAFAGYRLMPAFQQIFFSAVSVRFYLPALVSLHSDFVRIVGPENSARPDIATALPSIVLRHALELENVSFTYAGATSPALRNLSLKIRRYESVGLVGRTGAGKTTLADIILGVYEPDRGRVCVDGISLSGPAIRAWQHRVGYVPQSVFLANASVAENIAFGISRPDIDPAYVRSAALLAQAEEFIAELPQGYDTIVGERGVKLSGGQRQRIGIARALYHQPDILVFDEATSALDGLTEDAVMDAVRSLSGGRTIILIAHRLRTVEACSRIVMLDHGSVAAEGPYASLLETSEVFRHFVQAK